MSTKQMSARRSYKNGRKNRFPGIEILEKREMLAASFTLSQAGELKINAGSEAANVQVVDLQNFVYVTSRDNAGHIQPGFFNKAQVNKIVFQGSPYSDTFTNQTAIPDEIFGNSGNDILSGGRGRSFLAGGFGNDTYIFDTDFALGMDTLIEVKSGGTDTLDFSKSSAGVVIDLGRSSSQRVHKNLSLILGSSTVFENVIGTDAVDRISGNGLNNRLEGRGGNDSIYGRSGNDRLVGGFGDDNYIFDIDFAQGTDTLQEMAIWGGIDTLDFSNGSSGIVIDLERPSPQMVHKNLSLILGSSTAFENVIGTNVNDRILGNQLSNRLEGRGGNDYLNGRTGNDIYVFDTDRPLGRDTLEDPQNLSGSDTLDFYLSTVSRIVVDLSLWGKQRVNSNLELVLNSAFENVIGGSMNDVLIGNWLPNQLNGGHGNDTLEGRGGDDTLEGNGGDDNLRGGNDNDRYVFADRGLGHDTVTENFGGASGIDTLDFQRLDGSVSVDLGQIQAQTVNHGNLGLTLTSSLSVENVLGSRYIDIIAGNGLDNRIEGMAGSDIVSGRGGNDSLWGGSGVDILFGDEGDDRLIGGLDKDWLYGGNGDDGLYGGSDDSRDGDYLYGGLGQDRFLTRNGDHMQDKVSVDVQIRFSDGSSKWSDREIEVVDQAFAQLQKRAGSTRILDDPASTHALEFIKVKRNDEFDGRNSEFEFLFWFDREIEIGDWNEYNDNANWDAHYTVIHEIAHNWDESAEQNPYWSQFSKLNKESSSLDDFARKYGMKNPKEDWATCWEAYFGCYSISEKSTLFQRKLELVDAFFSDIA
ncbi:MAG: hypothetical protein JXA82_06785 [Sedimentisphaerales bacterium]|nr:hypothetical protein [Sedimentisphaerales bacterium]